MISINIAGGSVTNQQGRVFQYFGASEPGGNFSYEDDFNLSAQNVGGPNDNFRIDGHGRRVLRWVSPNNNHIFYIFDGDELIGEISRDGTPQVAYTWGNGLASLRNIQSSQSRYYHFGPQGETRHLTNSSGVVTDSYNYTAYGRPVASTGITYNPHRYGGKYGYYNHGLSGQLLAGHRWYSPYLMRWLTHDPIGYEGGTNLYEYVGGNPVRYVDPLGFGPEEDDYGPGATDPDFLPGLLAPDNIIAGILTGGVSVTSKVASKGLSQGENFLPRLIQNERGAIKNPLAGSCNLTEIVSKQFRKLSQGEIRKLKKAGIDVHELKPGAGFDLFKDLKGNIVVKPKNGTGPGDPTGLNILDF